MRGKTDQQLAMLTSVSTEDLIPVDHPIRKIRRIVDEVLVDLDGEFDAMYSRIGRPSIPPEQLLKASVLMALYSMRSERAFCERLNYDLLFKWFLDLPIDGKAFDATTFTKNRARLLDAEIADRFFAARPGRAGTTRRDDWRSFAYLRRMIAGPVTTHSWIWPPWWQVVIDVLVVALVICGIVRWRRRRRS